MRTLMLLLAGLFASDATTDMVEDLEPKLRANRDTYLAGPLTHTRKAQALAYFDEAWSYLTGRNGCGSRTLGEAGRRCIADRSRDGHWPWEAYYRDPIEQSKTLD